MRTYYVATAPAMPAVPTETKIFLPDYYKSEAAVQVTWIAPVNNGAPITGYKLYMSEGAREFHLIYDGTGRSDIISYTVTTNVMKTLNYNFKVSAINIIGESQESLPLTSLIAVVPSSPLNLTFMSSNSGTIEVSWEAPRHDGGATLIGYYIYTKQTLAGINAAFTKGTIISAQSLAIIVTGLTVDKEYALYITAANVKGQSI